jgi:CHASE2 domain-containing sensor protein
MRNIWVLSLAITVFIFAMLWVASIVTDLKLFSAFDPIGQALSDFELTDYAFSKLRDDPKPEERIVMVNIGHLGRREMAQQIQIISRFKPRVIGIDSFYNCEGGLYDTVNCPQLLDTLGNLLLSNAIQEAGNVVLVSKLMQTDSLSQAGDSDIYDSVEYSDPMFRNFSRSGFASLPTGARYQEDVKLCRSFFPRIYVKGKRQLAFSVQMAMVYDSLKTEQFLARDNDEEIINFRGNVEFQDTKTKALQREDLSASGFTGMFSALDVEDLLNGNFTPDLFKDKVVIMGFLGDYFGDPAWNDKFFTPLNKKVAGRANPDMFGLVIHANIVSMILNQDYVNELSDWEKYAIAFVVSLLTVALFITIDQNLPIWFDALQVIIQVVQILLFSALVVYMYVWFSFKLDIGITLAVSALVGPCYDIFKSIQNELIKRFTKPTAEVLNQR